MANTRTVGATGADHTTIGSAVAWFQSNHNFTTDGIGTIQIIDSAEYNEVVTISGIAGSPSSSAYLKLTASAGNRHAGVAGTGHARIRSSTNGSHAITVSIDFTLIEYLEIQQDSTGSSDEGIRITSGINDVVISRCIIWTDSAATDTDGIYTGNWAATYSIDNCILYGWARGGIHLQNFGGTETQTANIDYCTIYDCGTSSDDEGGIVSREVSGATNILNIYNTASLDPDISGRAFFDYETASTWTGTNNACTDTSLTTVGLTTGAQESLTVSATTQSSGSFFVVNNITAGTEDLLLLDDAAGNLAYGNGTTRVGSEPDSRQDFSLDIAGNTRSTTTPSPDIGASEYTAGGAFTLVGASGTYTLSGTAATLAAGRIMSADTASYSYSGTAAALNRGFNLSSNSGSYTYTGTAADLTFTGASNFTLAAATGTYTYSGTGTGLLFDRVLTSDSGTFSYSGTANALSRGYYMQASSDAYTYTGTNVDFLRSYVVGATAGNYAYNGTNVSLTATGQVWTLQGNVSTTWASQTDNPVTWTEQTDSNTVWNIT